MTVSPPSPVTTRIPKSPKATMLLSHLPEGLRARLVPVEAAATLFCALCWKVLAFAMYAEGYDLDPSAPVQPAGDQQIELLALLFACSVPVTWLLGRVAPPGLRSALDNVIVVRLAVALALSLVMFLGLLTGMRIPLLGWRI
ncbi:hypothetical protein AB0H18_37305 [Streptomyces sp. NPDC020766]|uniref:hypothetical protein n=1 Tax=Streptomyces sp. NPDC020766 TaxID=3155011 RepID=UPI0033BFCCC6